MLNLLHHIWLFLVGVVLIYAIIVAPFALPGLVLALIVSTAKDRNPITWSLFGAAFPPAFLVAAALPAPRIGFGVNPERVPRSLHRDHDRAARIDRLARPVSA